MDSYLSLHGVESFKISEIRQMNRNSVNNGEPFYVVDVVVEGADSTYKITLFADSADKLRLFNEFGTPITSSQPPVIQPFQPAGA